MRHRQRINEEGSRHEQLINDSMGAAECGGNVAYLAFFQYRAENERESWPMCAT